MKARYSRLPFLEAEIFGNSHEWHSLAAEITLAGSVVPFETSGDPAPYASWANEMRVVHLDGARVAFLTDDSGNLVLQGDSKFLELLSQTATNFAAGFRVGSHIHIDYQGDDHFVDRTSFSTTFRKVAE